MRWNFFIFLGIFFFEVGGFEVGGFEVGGGLGCFINIRWKHGF